jgi:23S rRNA pseudouridine1911/1915/1917 synthase
VARFRVEPTSAGERVDHAVVAALAGLTVQRARRLVAEGRVRVDGRRARKGERLAVGQIVEIVESAEDAVARDPDALRVQPDPELAVHVLYADDVLVAIDKPANMPSHPLAAGELATAANAIVARFPECATASPDPREGGLVHRLDTETSGVLLAARTARAWPELRAALVGGACVKVYLAEVAGEPPARGVADVEIGRVGRRGGRVRVGGGRRPLPARTAWEVLEPRDGAALVRAELHAGRAHQVRAHLAAAGYPILGDTIYGDARTRALAAARGESGLHLHAASVSFRHPLTGVSILIQSPPPAWAMMRG